MMSIAVVVVSLRVFSSWTSRSSDSGGLDASDWSSLISLIVSIAQSATVMTLHKYARHQWNISVGMMTPSYFERIFAQYFIAWVAIFLAKFSILWLYKRLFGIKPWMRNAVYAGIVWAAIAYFPNMAVAGYWCSAHIGEVWDFNVGIRCAEKAPLTWLVVSATMSVILDIYIFVLPIPIVLQLKLGKRQRLGLLFIFTTAAFAIVCAVLTLVYRVKLLKTTDSMWLSAQLFICNGVENYIAIIVGAMPACSAFFKAHIKDSALFTAITSGWSSMRGSTNKSTKASSRAMGPSYKLSDVSDTESQRALRPMPGQIGVKTTYTIGHSETDGRS